MCNPYESKDRAAATSHTTHPPTPVPSSISSSHLNDDARHVTQSNHGDWAQPQEVAPITQPPSSSMSRVTTEHVGTHTLLRSPEEGREQPSQDRLAGRNVAGIATGRRSTAFIPKKPDPRPGEPPVATHHGDSASFSGPQSSHEPSVDVSQVSIMQPRSRPGGIGWASRSIATCYLDMELTMLRQPCSRSFAKTRLAQCIASSN